MNRVPEGDYEPYEPDRPAKTDMVFVLIMLLIMSLCVYSLIWGPL